MTEYSLFRQRLDEVLRTRDVQQVTAFLVAEGQWDAGAPVDPDFAMWMMIAASPALHPLHAEARDWLISHGHEAEAQAVFDRGKARTTPTGKGKVQRPGTGKGKPQGSTSHKPASSARPPYEGKPRTSSHPPSTGKPSTPPRSPAAGKARTSSRPPSAGKSSTSPSTGKAPTSPRPAQEGKPPTSRHPKRTRNTDNA